MSKKTAKTNVRPLKVDDLDEVVNIEKILNKSYDANLEKMRISNCATSREEFVHIVTQKDPPTQCYIGELFLKDKMNGLDYPWVFGSLLIEVYDDYYKVILFSVSPYALVEVRKAFVDFLITKLRKDKRRNRIEIVLKDTDINYKNIFYLSGRDFTYTLVAKDGPDEWHCEYRK